MIQPIYLYGSGVLREVAAPADLNDKEGISTLVADLWETLAASEGCGLAAPQIGDSRRVAVVDGDIMSDIYPYLKGFKRTFINPVILSESESSCEYDEGCLSVPGIYAAVRRPDTIEVEYYDENLEKKVDGVLFTDLVAPVRRKMISRKLQNIARGKVGTAYKSKIK